MENSFLSLIYPTEESLQKHASLSYLPNITENVCEEIGLSRVFSLKNSNIRSFFTCDEDVIKYRQDAIKDMLDIPELGDTLNRALPILLDITELRRLDSNSSNTSAESYLYSITEIELYVSCIDTLFAGLSSVRDKIHSKAFSRLSTVIIELAESDYYRDLNKKLSELAQRVHEVKSITVGVNLDAQLRPCEAGVISINSESFKSGKILDKILRMSFKNDSMTCIAPLAPFGKGQSDNRREALISAFNTAIDEVFRTSVRSWRAIVDEYVLTNTDFLLKILPEIEFITRAGDITRTLIEKKYPLCVPEIAPMSEKAFSAVSLYNPDVALQIEDDVVDNDFTFDDDGRFYVLTGPNRGGKSVITCALGIAQAMMQLGMYVPAKQARISPADAIFTHFPDGAETTIDKGRLGEECARLQEIFSAMTENSLILLDESLSSTGSYEASYIAAEILAGFGMCKCRGIFSTHLHELAASIDSINERSLEAGGIRIDTLVAGIEEGKRSFKIRRAKPDGKSYARDIAEKYGLSFDEIKRLVSRS